ncbi:MAG: hypothetical protein ACYC67_14740 [Prosthecobacter sp.]
MSSAPSSPAFSFKNRPLTQGACLLLLACGGLASAADPAVFTPPQPYPASRYEAGWSKNPFTLKTAAPIAAQDTFARDLAIGAHYGAADNPTVVIVNTKTHERILLRRDQPAPGGMRLKSVHLSSHRSECQVEVLQGTEGATLTYDATYLSQMAAGEASRMAAAKASAASPARGLRLPAPPAAKSPASPQFKVSNLEPPVPIPPASPLQNRLTLPSLPPQAR